MNNAHTPDRPTALIVIDIQEGFEDLSFWGTSSNPACEENIRILLDAWRARDWPIVIVRHDSPKSASPLHPGHPGNQLRPVVQQILPDLFITKEVNSAFYGTPDLHAWLGSHGLDRMVLCGIQSNMCVETTARMAGNLGYDVTVAIDATRTFDLATTVPGIGDIAFSAEDLRRATALNLQAGGFAKVTSTAEVVSSIQK